MAEASIGSMGGDEQDPSYVDAGHRKDSAETSPDGKPLVAGPALRERAWAHNITNPIRNPCLSNRFRFFHKRYAHPDRCGEDRQIALQPRSVADFYRATLETLKSLGIEVSIWTTPVEVEERIPFELDTKHATYDRRYARRCWRVFSQADRVMKQFRSGFLGKVSPVHFFWGSFDLAVARFSGRRAPMHGRCQILPISLWPRPTRMR